MISPIDTRILTERPEHLRPLTDAERIAEAQRRAALWRFWARWRAVRRAPRAAKVRTAP